MRTDALSSRTRAVVFGLAAGMASVSAITGGSLTAAAQTNASIPGSISVFAVSGTFHIQQLSVSSDGKLWFATKQSQLGAISSNGQATLTGVVLPHGTVPGVIGGAGPEGVWSYANEFTSSTGPVTCVLSLVTPDMVVHPITLPSIVAQGYCGGAAADTSGNLWVSVSDLCHTLTCGQRVSFVVKVTPAGAVTLLPPPGAGKRAGPVVLASDGAIWALGGHARQVLGRYSPSGSSIGISIPTAGLFGLLPRPDGTFWGWKPIFCSGAVPPQCLRVTLFSPGGSTRLVFLFPASINPSGPSGVDQLGVSSDGSLWRAGRERTQPDRFFRMNGNGTIDRSAAFPTASGSALSDDGTLAVTTTGQIWSSAQTSSGAEYLIRFQPV